MAPTIDSFGVDEKQAFVKAYIQRYEQEIDEKCFANLEAISSQKGNF